MSDWLDARHPTNELEEFYCTNALSYPADAEPLREVEAVGERVGVAGITWAPVAPL